MSEKKHDREGRRGAPPDPIAELVRLQQAMIQSWGELAVKSIYRWQSGNLDLTPWFDAYRKLTGETTDDFLDVVRLLGRLRG